jgi:phenylalanyl-tRNA synthetase beta chain
VTRDLAVVVRTAEPYESLAGLIRSTAGSLLEQLQLVDEYRGAQVPKDHRSLAFRLTFRDPQRTLTTDEVNTVVERIVEALKQQFGATLRA